MRGGAFSRRAFAGTALRSETAAMRGGFTASLDVHSFDVHSFDVHSLCGVAGLQTDSRPSWARSAETARCAGAFAGTTPLVRGRAGRMGHAAADPASQKRCRKSSAARLSLHCIVPGARLGSRNVQNDRLEAKTA